MGMRTFVGDQGSVSQIYVLRVSQPHPYLVAPVGFERGASSIPSVGGVRRPCRTLVRFDMNKGSKNAGQGHQGRLIEVEEAMHFGVRRRQFRIAAWTAQHERQFSLREQFIPQV